MKPHEGMDRTGEQHPSRVGRPTREQAVHRRNHLLDEAAKAFVELGFDGASIDVIAARAHVSKPTIYAHFQNKAGLFTATVEHVLQHRLGRARKVSAASSGVEALRQQVANILTAVMEPTYLGLFKLYLAESDRLPEVFLAFSNSTDRGSRQLLLSVLQRYPEFQSLRVSAEEAADFILQCMVSPAVRAVAEPHYRQNLSAEQEADKIIDRALFGLMSP